jgi:hypothetical protein
MQPKRTNRPESTKCPWTQLPHPGRPTVGMRSEKQGWRPPSVEAVPDTASGGHTLTSLVWQCSPAATLAHHCRASRRRAVSSGLGIGPASPGSRRDGSFPQALRNLRMFLAPRFRGGSDRRLAVGVSGLLRSSLWKSRRSRGLARICRPDDFLDSWANRPRSSRTPHFDVSFCPETGNRDGRPGLPCTEVSPTTSSLPPPIQGTAQQAAVGTGIWSGCRS